MLTTTLGPPPQIHQVRLMLFLKDIFSKILDNFTAHYSNYCINVAKNIGQNENIDIKKHSSVLEIRQNPEGSNIRFQMFEIPKTLNPKKATG